MRKGIAKSDSAVYYLRITGLNARHVSLLASVLAFKETSKFVKQIYSKRVQLLTSTSLILKKKTKQQKSYMKQSKNHPKTKEKLLTKRQVHSITLQGLNCPPLRGSQHLYPSINHHCRQQALQAPAQTMISLPNP